MMSVSSNTCADNDASVREVSQIERVPRKKRRMPSDLEAIAKVYRRAMRTDEGSPRLSEMQRRKVRSTARPRTRGLYERQAGG